MSAKNPLRSLIFITLVLVIVLSVVLILLGVPGDRIVSICLGLEILIGLAVLAFLIYFWVKKK